VVVLSVLLGGVVVGGEHSLGFGEADVVDQLLVAPPPSVSGSSSAKTCG
jgi:hypothetical protein